MLRTKHDLPFPRILRAIKNINPTANHLESIKDITNKLLVPTKLEKRVQAPVPRVKSFEHKSNSLDFHRLKDNKELTREIKSCGVTQEKTKVVDSRAVNILRGSLKPRVQTQILKVEPPVIEPFVVNTSLSNRKVSVIIGIRGRDRLAGLFHVIKSFRDQTVAVRIILVEQDEKAICQDKETSLVDKYIFTYSNRLYNRSWAFNCGSLLTDDEFLILHDCDLIAPRDYVEKSLTILGGSDFGFGWYQINYMTESSSKNYPKEKPEFKGSFLNKQTVGGSLIIRNDFYKTIKGMDERFEGWGGEDNVFHFKACALGRLAWDGTDSGSHLIHYYHDDKNRNHDHGHINHSVIAEYYRGDRAKLRERISNLPPMGYPNRFGESFLVDHTSEEALA